MHCIERYLSLSVISTVIFCTIGINAATNFQTIAPDKLKTIEVGINLATEAFEAVCWYEFLKHYLPKTRSFEFNHCHGQANFQRKIVFQHGADERFFGQFLMEHGMQKLPREYQQCTQYLLENRYSTNSKDYSKILKSNATIFPSEVLSTNKSQIPYQAFSDCLLFVVHDKYGDVALEKIGDKLENKQDWAETMFERENDFRALHGVPRLRLNDELTQRAQKWAEQLARSCAMYHIHSSHPDYLLNGSRMGENLFMGDSIKSPKADMALFGTNIWYEEIKYYPYPEYRGYGNDKNFHEFAHFSQMIWKGSQMVGYGFAVNENESCGQYFIVSRYFPPGNFWTQFRENVPPLLEIRQGNVNRGGAKFITTSVTENTEDTQSSGFSTTNNNFS